MVEAVVTEPRIRVLMVCMGNICRSPTAEAVLRSKLQQAGLADAVQVDSAGTHAYHVGHAPDKRSQRHAAIRGYELSALRARQVNVTDFQRFDWLLAMDHDNLAGLQRLCPDPAWLDKLRLFLSFAPQSGLEEVPDPYYGGVAGFEQVLDLCEAGARGILAMYARQQAEGK